MNEKPLVSIIMPSFNAAKYIEESISSVLNQTYENWELIICDDFSTDNTRDILGTYDNEKITIILHEKNIGVTQARNSALKKAKGKYYAFLDSDDLWLKDKLTNQIEFMEKKNIMFSSTSYGIIKNNIQLDKIFPAVEKLEYFSYMKNTSIGNSTVIIRNDIQEEFEIQEGPLEDVVTWLMLLKKNNICYGLDEKLAMYRITEGSASSNKISNAKKYYVMLREKQSIGFVKAIYYEICYMFNAIRKRLF